MWSKTITSVIISENYMAQHNVIFITNKQFLILWVPVPYTYGPTFSHHCDCRCPKPKRFTLSVRRALTTYLERFCQTILFGLIIMLNIFHCFDDIIQNGHQNPGRHDGTSKHQTLLSGTNVVTENLQLFNWKIFFSISKSVLRDLFHQVLGKTSAPCVFHCPRYFKIF